MILLCVHSPPIPLPGIFQQFSVSQCIVYTNSFAGMGACFVKEDGVDIHAFPTLNVLLLVCRKQFCLIHGINSSYFTKCKPGSSVCIASNYRLDNWGLFLTEAEYFSCSLCIQTSSGANPASCTRGARGSFLGGKSVTKV